MRNYHFDYYKDRSSLPIWHAEARLVSDLVKGIEIDTIIDLGCGTGELLSAIKPRIGIGYDLNQTAIDLAKERNPEFRFEVAGATRIFLENESVDAIVNMHLFEHLIDPVGAITEWHRVLKKDGKLVILTPNAVFSHPEVFYDPDHKHIYSPEELINFFNDHGFAKIDAQTLGVWGFRGLPFIWRFQPMVECIRLPAIPGVRWIGQSLAVSGSKI